MMAKTEARKAVRRARAALAQIDHAITNGTDMDTLLELCNEAIGSVAIVQEIEDRGAYWVKDTP